MITRRQALLATALVAAPAIARAGDRVLRIGYQKYGTLVLLKGRGTLEPKLRALGVRVQWAEFPAGPALLEALNAGGIDVGSTGEAPPIFAQAAGVPLVYIANEPPAPRGEAVLVLPDSKLNTLSDLRGKRIALNRGSNVHYLLVRALQSAGLRYDEVSPVWLPPADARAAFTRGDVDGWAIWDPFLAAAQVATPTRVLADGTNLAPNRQFYLAGTAFAAANAETLGVLVSALAETNQWMARDPETAIKTLGPAIGIPLPILDLAVKRQSFGIAAVADDVVADQQRIADTFLELGLISRPIHVADAIRRLPA